MTVRVVLADDQALIRGGFRALVESADDMEVVGEVDNGADAVAVVRETRPDVVLMDVRMPGVDGLAATRAITGDADLAAVRVLVSPRSRSTSTCSRRCAPAPAASSARAPPARELLDGIRLVARGEALLSPTATRTLIARFLAQPQRWDGAVPDRFHGEARRPRPGAGRGDGLPVRPGPRPGLIAYRVGGTPGCPHADDAGHGRPPERSPA